MTTAIVSYIPVPHLGYFKLIERHQPADVILLPLDTIRSIDPIIGGQLSRDMELRGISPYLVKQTIQAWSESFESLSFQTIVLRSFDRLKQYQSIVMPDEDVSHLIEDLIPWATVEYDTWFQRWDWRNTNIPKEVITDHTISTTDFDRYIMNKAQRESRKSSDFWRQVGAVVPSDQGLLVAFNEHMPTGWEPYINGCMRIIFQPGEKPEICGALHGEKGIFAQALRYGLKLGGKDLYVTTFPCLQCAQLIAAIGMKKLFFRDGYSNQNATEVLKSAGVEIIRVQ